MPDSTVIIDAVARPYNLAPDNPAEGATAQLAPVSAPQRLAFGRRYGSRRC